MARSMDKGTDGCQLITETLGQRWRRAQLNRGALSWRNLTKRFTIFPQLLVYETGTKSCFEEETPPGHTTQAWLPPQLWGCHTGYAGTSVQQHPELRAGA